MSEADKIMQGLSNEILPPLNLPNGNSESSNMVQFDKIHSKTILVKQLELLHERSKKCSNKELAHISDAMIRIADVLGIYNGGEQVGNCKRGLENR